MGAYGFLRTHECRPVSDEDDNEVNLVDDTDYDLYWDAIRVDKVEATLCLKGGLCYHHSILFFSCHYYGLTRYCHVLLGLQYWWHFLI